MKKKLIYGLLMIVFYMSHSCYSMINAEQTKNTGKEGQSHNIMGSVQAK